jgi:hypothetical protein
VEIGLFVLKSPDLVDHRILVVRAGMEGNVLILQPGIVGSIEKAMDLVHHAAEGMPAHVSFQTQTVKSDRIPHPVAKHTRSVLFKNLHLDTIGCFHGLFPSFITTHLSFQWSLRGNVVIS